MKPISAISFTIVVIGFILLYPYLSFLFSLTGFQTVSSGVTIPGEPPPPQSGGSGGNGGSGGGGAGGGSGGGGNVIYVDFNAGDIFVHIVPVGTLFVILYGDTRNDLGVNQIQASMVSYSFSLTGGLLLLLGEEKSFDATHDDVNDYSISLTGISENMASMEFRRVLPKVRTPVSKKPLEEKPLASLGEGPSPTPFSGIVFDGKRLLALILAGVVVVVGAVVYWIIRVILEYRRSVGENGGKVFKSPGMGE